MSRSVFALMLVAITLSGTFGLAQSNQDDAEFRYRVGLAALQADDLSVALREFEAAARLAPNNALVQYNLALVYQRNRAFAAAVTSLERAITLGLPSDLRKLAAELLPKLSYENIAEGNRIAEVNAAAEADLAWLVRQTDTLMAPVCRIGVMFHKFEIRRGPGSACELTAIVNSRIGYKDTPVVFRVDDFLTRVRSIKRTSMQTRDCSNGESLGFYEGVDIQLESTDPNTSDVTFWKQEKGWSTRMRSALRSAIQYCSAIRK